jgi:hypothetical protein
MTGVVFRSSLERESTLVNAQNLLGWWEHNKSRASGNTNRIQVEAPWDGSAERLWLHCPLIGGLVSGRGCKGEMLLYWE